MVFIRGGLGSLFPCPDLLGDLTRFGDKKEEEHIYHLYLDTCLNLAPFHYHDHLRVSVLMPLIPLCPSHYPQITGA